MLERELYVDARHQASLSRFMNHSCDPNCTTQKWNVLGETRVAILSLRDIEAHEELTFDYQWQSYGRRNQRYLIERFILSIAEAFSIRCFCEARNCRGVLAQENQEDDTLSTASGIFQEAHADQMKFNLVNHTIRILDPEEKIFKTAFVDG